MLASMATLMAMNIYLWSIKRQIPEKATWIYVVIRKWCEKKRKNSLRSCLMSELLPSRIDKNKNRTSKNCLFIFYFFFFPSNDKINGTLNKVSFDFIQIFHFLVYLRWTIEKVFVIRTRKGIKKIIVTWFPFESHLSSFICLSRS